MLCFLTPFYRWEIEAQNNEVTTQCHTTDKLQCQDEHTDLPSPTLGILSFPILRGTMASRAWLVLGSLCHSLPAGGSRVTLLTWASAFSSAKWSWWCCKRKGTPWRQDKGKWDTPWWESEGHLDGDCLSFCTSSWTTGSKLGKPTPRLWLVASGPC